MRNLALVLIVQPELLISRRIEVMVGVDQCSLLLGEGALPRQDRRGASGDCARDKLATRQSRCHTACAAGKMVSLRRQTHHAALPLLLVLDVRRSSVTFEALREARPTLPMLGISPHRYGQIWFPRRAMHKARSANVS